MTDFVFRENGAGGLEFVGDFDGLYRAETDPWGQSGGEGFMARYYVHSRRRIVDVIERTYVGVSRHQAIAIGLEVGCGHGHALSFIADMSGGSWQGCDISSCAIKTARSIYEEDEYLSFFEADITDFHNPLPTYDVVILNQVLWYILHKLNVAVANCHALLRENGVLVVSQGFLRAGEQRYGLDTAEGFHGTLATFLGRYSGQFKLIEARYDDGTELPLHDGLMVFRRR